MTYPNPWPAAIATLLGLAVLAVLLGWLSGHVLAALFLLALGLLAWDLYNLRRMERWLRRGHKLEPPNASGLWGHVFNGLYRIQRRQRRRRKQLRNLVRRYDDSARAMPDATAVLRGDYHVAWWNDAAARILGLVAPQDAGQRITNILRHPDFVDFLSTDTGDARTLTLPSPIDRRRMLEVRLVPYGRKQHLLLARDVTHLHRLETMRRDFVANVSHELRTPLTVIRGVAENLEGDLRDRPELQRPLVLLQEQTHRMQRLIDDLLTLSRLETGHGTDEPHPVDVDAVLRSLVEDARSMSAERGHHIDLDSTAGLVLRGSESGLRSLFSNLIHNAIKYTPEDGHILVQWAPDPEREGARFAVTDTGIGIPAHHIDRLTERFYRVDDSRSGSTGGTGLGLAIVKHVLNRHQGELEIDSCPGEGSTFACRFPADVVGRPGDDENHGIQPVHARSATDDDAAS